jgi:predicted aldo/keto reductase-like oxidoreductase
MKRIELGRTGMLVNRIGFGGIPIQRLSFEDSDRLLEKAFDSGINFFDSARAYTNSEEKMGRVFPKYRDKVYLASKTLNRTADGAAADVEISLKNFKTDYIDLYQCHNIPNEADLEKILAPGGVLEALIKAKEAGKIRHIGVTVHKPWIGVKALGHFETVQVPFNIIESAALENLIPEAKKKKVGLIAMKPVAGGALNEVALNLRYILNSGMDVAIPGMDELDQVEKNLSVLKNLKPLSENEMAKLNAEKDRLGDNFCRRCEYCMPCPNGLNISFLHVLKAYYYNYDLKDWVYQRLAALPKTFKDCTQCGECVKKCPYALDMPEIFRQAAADIEK